MLMFHGDVDGGFEGHLRGNADAIRTHHLLHVSGVCHHRGMRLCDGLHGALAEPGHGANIRDKHTKLQMFPIVCNHLRPLALQFRTAHSQPALCRPATP